MFRFVSFTLFFLINQATYCQDDFKPLNKIIKKNNKKLRILQYRTDSVNIFIGYSKVTHLPLGIHLYYPLHATDRPVPGLEHLALFFLPGDSVYLKASAFFSDKKHLAEATYLFRGTELIMKNENKYVEHDLSILYSRYDELKKFCIDKLKEKFGEQ